MTEPDLTIVTMVFDTEQPEELSTILSRYVVLTRTVHGCVNVDLSASATRPGRFSVIEKWATAEAHRAHFDSELMTRMAREVAATDTARPAIDLWFPISAHDRT